LSALQFDRLLIMEHWQFLIQKQGEYSWYTLESPNLNIVAGKYRVLARSHLPNADVEIRVTHLSNQEIPPKRRILKRLRRTNAEGLMAVIPFTYFHPGTWELRCSGDLLADILGNSWQYAVKMQVASAELTERSDNLLDGLDGFQESTTSVLHLHPDSHPVVDQAAISLQIGAQINALLNEVEEDIFTDQPVSPVWFKGETAEQILQSLIDLTLPKAEDEQSDSVVVDALTTQLFKLNLDQDYYIAHWGEALTISGYVEPKETEVLQEHQLPLVNLVVELRSPLESNQILAQFQQDLVDKIPPFRFSVNIKIPAHCESKLILANIKLHSLSTDGSFAVLLGSHAFTITADVTELLTITSRKAPTPDRLTQSSIIPPQLTDKSSATSFKLGLELFNLVKFPSLKQLNIFKPAAKQTLPPQIKPIALLSKLDDSSEKLPLQLPKLPQNQPNPLVITNISETQQPDKNLNMHETIPAIDLGKLVIKQLKTSFPYLKRLRTATKKIEIRHLDSPNLPNLPNESPNPTISESQELVQELVDVPSPPESESIDPIASVANLAPGDEINLNTPEVSPLLKLWIQREDKSTTEYFYGDYTSQSRQEQLLAFSEAVQLVETLGLENTTPLSDELVSNIPASGVEIETQIEDGDNVLAEDAIALKPPSISITPVWLSEEIVIDDTTVELADGDVAQPAQPELDLSQINRGSLPTPQLYLPDGELLAGTSVKVRIELPQLLPSVAIKLWVEDCQTRYLLDGPHLITNLKLNLWGVLEAVTQLNIPFGCLEMRLEAIAIDTSTQQESHKVSIIKTVIPPDLPRIEPDQLMDL
jgi:hypothetical protein